jgi:hypothetical protein
MIKISKVFKTALLVSAVVFFNLRPVCAEGVQDNASGRAKGIQNQYDNHVKSVDALRKTQQAMFRGGPTSNAEMANIAESAQEQEKKQKRLAKGLYPIAVKAHQEALKEKKEHLEKVENHKVSFLKTPRAAIQKGLLKREIKKDIKYHEKYLNDSNRYPIK